jgi:histidine triad (HIT) family protein
MWMRIARSRLARWLIPWIFARMSFLIPADRLRETDTLIAFRHPQPSYPVHILIVPKRAIADLRALTPGDGEFLEDLFRCAGELAGELGLEEVGYRLIANGGRYQEIPQLHFHLISGERVEGSG